ncbi:MAG: N-acetyltransferase [Hyphomonadaceae bacterium]|nr:N-acetyltransferase [Hyphomonadaceae bacterium]
MDGSGAVTIEVVDALAKVDRAAWNALANPPGAPFDPFVSHEFLAALEESGCVSPAAGWTPVHLIAHGPGGVLTGAMPLYVKDHSYGEYVFDHAWADALHRAGGRYYPKLQCAAPFTPVPGRRIFAHHHETERALAQAAKSLAERVNASSVHVTFAEQEACSRLGTLGYLTRVGLQYHWFNRGYETFDDFLDALSSQKRKSIRRERQRACEGVRVRCLRGAEIRSSDWDFFFQCYLDTGSRKWGSPYLNRAFFRLLSERMAERCVLFVAEDGAGPIAAALNFIGGEALYGRYWGRVRDVPFLHFELCYYQAIELAIEMKLPRVEAGAQGDHKLARGYVPVSTHSAHWIAHAGLRGAIARYLEAETPAIVDEAEVLAEHAPFKKETV